MSPPAWKLVGILLLVLTAAGALFSTYYQGVTVTHAKWQLAWSDRNTRDAEAKATNEAAERTKEQAYQQSINKAVQDGQRIIDQATTDAVAARASADSLRGAADNLANRLAASEASGHSCTAAASQAASRAAMVLADVLKRADQRAGDLAEVADQTRARGLTCEAAYGAMTK
ncbi:DUF2514 family protein [Pseudomonas fluorescens]|uniref:DUF2514 family protein n=1 Tax=Pseudomonas fluorescens TaxID=294 RepID=UPI0005FB1C45|nr:DUF2514 family protein [Pseudomonas fluorescens]KJZ39633.1 hypothetical protein VC33_07775 [Pseudomonas fluorescens]